MRDALYLNGVFDGVLQEIVTVQAVVPEQILFMQPFSMSQISAVAKEIPTPDDPMRLYVSITTDLTHVHYVGEVVGWEDKRTIASDTKVVFETLIKAFQPGETNLYAKGVNILVVRRMVKLAAPFSVGHLVVRSTMEPLGERATAGNWAFVLPEPTGVTLPTRTPPVSRWRIPTSSFDTIPQAETA
jgi:hypothetical protein